MATGSGAVVKPPEAQNLFLCLAIIVGLIWIFNACRRCFSVAQLRRSLGSRRLVAIRGAGSRVRIFRLLTRNYLQRTLARNHLQALVHTRQACPPKVMPCSLLVASPVGASGGVRAMTHPHDVDNSSPTASGVAREAGALVGISLKLDCRVACTVELLWDVDLAFLGREMGLPPKLHLLPAITREGNANVTAAAVGSNASWMNRSSRSRGATANRPPTPRRASSRRGLPGAVSSLPARFAALWHGPDSPASSNRAPIQHVSARTAHASSASFGDEEMGAADVAPPGSAEIGGGSRRDGSSARVGEVGGGGSSSSSSGGGGGIGSSIGGRAWTAAVGLRKTSVVAGGPEGPNGSSSVSQVGTACGQSGRAALGGATGRVSCTTGCSMRTVPRALGAGRGQVFEALPSESYFRMEQRRTSSGGAGDDGGGAGGGEGGMSSGGTGATSSAPPSASPRGAAGGTAAAWPRIADSVPAGRCSLAIVLRPADGEALGSLTEWRHRPTHRVTRQVLLVQLKEGGDQQVGGQSEDQSPRHPTAEVLRHLVAISNGTNGQADSIFSFSEVFGATGAAGVGQAGLSLASVGGSTQATVGGGGGGGSSSSAPNTVDTVGGAAGAGAAAEAQEECVICLTDPKTTLLLPCRHLCVCNDCFRHVDKCPVCRSAFDNYVVLQGPHAAQPQAVAMAANVTPEPASEALTAAARRSPRVRQTASSSGRRGGGGNASGAHVGESGLAPARRTIFAVGRRRPPAEQSV